MRDEYEDYHNLELHAVSHHDCSLTVQESIEKLIDIIKCRQSEWDINVRFQYIIDDCIKCDITIKSEDPEEALPTSLIIEDIATWNSGHLREDIENIDIAIWSKGNNKNIVVDYWDSIYAFEHYIEEDHNGIHPGEEY